MARVLAGAGKTVQALHYAQQAAALAPERAMLHELMGQLLIESGRPLEAAEALARAIHLDGRTITARVSLGIAFALADRPDEAEAAFRDAIALDPAAVKARRNLAKVLGESARVEEAVGLLRETVALAPREFLPHADLAMMLNYLPGADPSAVFAAHRAAAAVIEAQAGPPQRWTLAPGDADRPLRVGVLSPDLRSHSVAFFIEPFFEQHDRARVSLIAYDTRARPDETTARLKARATAWRDAAALSDDQLDQLIVQDRIDVLLDLAGWTGGARPGVLARKPAPVQVTYLGYPNTTGLLAVDARFVDSLTDPPGSESRTTERLIRLDPVFLCYRPPAHAPEPSPPPRDTAGVVTFGSFNALKKINPRCVGLWARVLHETPGSRMLLKAAGLSAPSVRARIASWFHAHGIGPDRVEMTDYVNDRAGHLGLYGKIDAALDTFPYHGTTTTCEALHMGVPTITRVGDVHAARVGLSLNTAVGLQWLAASTDDDFVRAATDLVRDAPELARRRAELRQRLGSSPLCDQPAFARRLESALCDLWRRACGA